MHVLLLTPRIPYPLRDGGAMAMHQTIQAYLDLGYEVSLLSMNTSRHWVEESTLPALYNRLTAFRTVFVNTNINPLSAFFNLFSDKSYQVARFIQKEFEQELLQLLSEATYDMIQFESIYTSPYLQVVQQKTKALCICRVHNIEHQIWQRLASHESNFLKRKYLELLTGRLKTFELQVLRRFDLLLPISKKEEAFLTQQDINTCYYLPYGVEDDKQLPAIVSEPASCFHIGSMDWAPNLEGVQWFLHEVWSEIRHEFPGVILYLAGKNMPASIRAQTNEQLCVVGEVDDVDRFCLEKNIMLVPLLSGAGIRVKLLEAMLLGKTIITTAVGAEGLGLTHEEQVLIADDKDLFRAALHRCFDNPELSKKIGEQARCFVLQHYRRSEIYRLFSDYLTVRLTHA